VPFFAHHNAEVWLLSAFRISRGSLGPDTWSLQFGVVPIPTLPFASITNGEVSPVTSLTTKLLPVPSLVIVRGTFVPLELIVTPVEKTVVAVNVFAPLIV
jgi:hypothetical protein